MAISAKYRRHIQVAGSQYLWWVTEMLEDDFLGSLAATVASEDRQLLVRYGLSQVDDRRFIVVLGPSFRGLPGLGEGFGVRNSEPLIASRPETWRTSSPGAGSSASRQQR
jgi:hypothetical protein